MKGQVKIEFVLGLVIFAVIIFYVASRIDTAFISINTDTRLDMLKSKSISMLELLANDKQVGLSAGPETLNRTRVNAWEADDCKALDEFDMGGYRFIIQDENDGEILKCGYVGISALQTIVVRHVKLRTDADVITYGNMTMEMW